MKQVRILLLAALLLPSVAFAQGTEVERDACEGDVFKWFAWDIPDDDAIEACLRRSIRWISPACQAQFGYRSRRR